jgi:hypothetical protein
VNPIRTAIGPGLSAWRRKGANVDYLIFGGLKVPRIWFGPKKNDILLLASGLHLEETSGPLLLLNPDKLLAAFESLTDAGLNLLIYPVINQHGLKFSPDANDKLLRYNAGGVNYNDGWGLRKKCKEVSLVEKDILNFQKSFRIIFAQSMHEDSDLPKKGYVYSNGIHNASFRKKLRKYIQASVKDGVLASSSLVKNNIPKSELIGARIEDFLLVESHDKGSMEEWLAYDLGIPTLLSEAPFGLTLKTRQDFHFAVLGSLARELTLARRRG